LSSTSTTSSAVCASIIRFSPYRSTGKERDAESGNDYFGARYYASAMGRFMSPDWSAKIVPVPYAKLGNPQSLNLYAYLLNNPLAGIDADGHDMQCGSNVGQCSKDLKKLAPGTKVDADGTVHKPGAFRRLVNDVSGHGAGTALVSRLVDNAAMTKVDPIMAGGRWPGHKITKNCCAPFIHSFIVDEWETTNLNRPLV